MNDTNMTVDRDAGLRAYLTGFAKADWESLSELHRVDWMKLSKDLLNHRAIKILEGLPTHEVINILSGAVDMRDLIGQVLSEHEEEIASLNQQDKENLTKAIHSLQFAQRDLESLGYFAFSELSSLIGSVQDQMLVIQTELETILSGAKNGASHGM